MTENQTDKEPPNATARPPPPPAGATNYISRKRLLAYSNPKQQCPTTQSLQSSQSSDSSSRQPRKKTRYLPNLSDCHSCGTRVNNTDPESRLQILDSVWRVVLLCKVCIKRVELAEICTYCFGKTSGSDCFKCRDCIKFIHKDCVVKYGKSPPWSYCHLVSEFSVCVDCWLPNSVANSIRVCSGRRNRSKLSKSRGLLNGSGPKLSEDLVEDKENIENVAKGEEKPLRKAEVVEKAVAFANFVLDWITNSDTNCENLVNDNGAKLLEDVVEGVDLAVEKKVIIAVNAKEKALQKLVVAENTVASGIGVLGWIAKNAENVCTCLDDRELALRLHRAIKSSPGIAKKFCSVNLSLSEDRQLNETRHRTVCNSSNQTHKECQENGEIGMAILAVTDNLHSVLKYYKRRDKLIHKLHSKVHRTQGSGDSAMLFYSRRKQKGDHYLFKYRRRPLGLKAVKDGESRCLYEALLLYNQTSAPGLNPDCSKELRMSSVAPPQSRL